MAEIKYPDSRTSKNILARHSEGIISQEEINLYNFLASTFPEQVIETLTTDDSDGYITKYNEDILILLFTVAKLFGSSKEVIKDLDYAYDVSTLKTSNKPNTDNLLLLLADQVNFSYLEGQSLEDLTEDARAKSAFIENYGAIKRRRGTRKALEIILDLFKNYIIETGVLEEFKYSIETPSEEAQITKEEAQITKMFTALNKGEVISVKSWDTKVESSFEVDSGKLKIQGPEITTYISQDKTWYYVPVDPTESSPLLMSETEFLITTENDGKFRILLTVEEPGEGTWKIVNPTELYIILQDFDANTFISKDNRQYIDYDGETYIKLKQDHFLYKMIMDIKPAGVIYNIILNYIATVLYTQEEVVAYQNRDKQFIKPKLTFKFETGGGTPANIAPKVFETQSVRFTDIIQGVNISQEHHYFEYWEDSKGREPSISDTYTANETFTAVWYPQKKAIIKFWQRNTSNNNATQIGSDRVLYGSRQDNVVITPSMVPTPASYDTYEFNGWVDSSENPVPLNYHYSIKVLDNDTVYDFYTTYSQNPRLSAPAIIKAEAVTTGARTDNLSFNITVRNTDTQPAKIRANIGGVQLTTPSEVLPNGVYTFKTLLSYTSEARPVTGWATVQALNNGTKPNSLINNVSQAMWQMTGVAREPKFDLKIRLVHMQNIFNNLLGIPHDTLNHEKVLGIYNWMVLAEAKITENRDWRNINTYIKVGFREILLSKELEQVAYYVSAPLISPHHMEKQIRIAGAVNQAARNLDSNEYNIEDSIDIPGASAPTVAFPIDFSNKQVLYSSASGANPARVEMMPRVLGSSLDEPAYIIPIIKYKSKAFLGETRWRGKFDGDLDIYKNGYGQTGNQVYIFLDADGPTAKNFPDELEIYYIAVTIDKSLARNVQTLSVHKNT